MINPHRAQGEGAGRGSHGRAAVRASGAMMCTVSRPDDEEECGGASESSRCRMSCRVLLLASAFWTETKFQIRNGYTKVCAV
ncbi:unnamed protein product [Urochloa humidicola]